jgi:hypothetical protein
MAFQFRKHYNRDEARALLPEIRDWLKRLGRLRESLSQQDQRLARLLAAGNDAGGELVNQWVRTVAATKGVLQQFAQREIQVKDLDRGLIDFPAIIGGREVFLCWEQDEDDVEFWHDLNSGYAGRERL